MRAITPILLLATAVMTVPVSAHVTRGDVAYTYSLNDIQAGAQLRAEAGILMPILFNPCGTSPAMDGVSDRYAEFVQSLTLVRQRIDLDIALADHDYRMSLVDVECLPLDDPRTLEREKIEVSVANSVLDRMARLVEEPSRQDK